MDDVFSIYNLTFNAKLKLQKLYQNQSQAVSVVFIMNVQKDKRNHV